MKIVAVHYLGMASKIIIKFYTKSINWKTSEEKKYLIIHKQFTHKIKKFKYGRLPSITPQ